MVHNFEEFKDYLTNIGYRIEDEEKNIAYHYNGKRIESNDNRVSVSYEAKTRINSKYDWVGVSAHLDLTLKANGLIGITAFSSEDDEFLGLFERRTAEIILKLLLERK